MAALQNAQAHAAGAGFFQAFDFAHADVGGELIAFGNGALGVGCARIERALDYVLRQIHQMIVARHTSQANIRSDPCRFLRNFRASPHYIEVILCGYSCFWGLAR